MTVEKAILEALQKAVTAARAATTLPAASVKYVGRNFTKPADGSTWLEVVHIPNNVTGECWGDEKTHRGILRLILHCPMTDEGAYTSITLMETIAAHFAKGQVFSDLAVTVRVRITDNPNLLGVLEEPPEMLIPVSIRYEFFNA